MIELTDADRDAMLNLAAKLTGDLTDAETVWLIYSTGKEDGMRAGLERAAVACEAKRESISACCNTDSHCVLVHTLAVDLCVRACRALKDAG